ncbi:MAG: transglutaminase domain-containing protein [FCB group bacterium]|nr:transglutaminase domain-containing protein [FCB group bacterium]
MKNNSVFKIAILLLVSILVFYGCHVSGKSEQAEKRSIQFVYSVTVEDIPDDTKTLDLWIPVPQDFQNQTIRDVQIESDIPYQFTSDKEYGNKFVYLHSENGIPDKLNLSLSFQATRRIANHPDETILTETQLNAFLESDFLVPIDGRIKSEAMAVLGDQADVIQKARTLYDHIVSTMDYDKSGEGWGRGDALYACDIRKGNCTDFHSLFIGMARAGGIPSRFIMGIPLPDDKTTGVIPGYHCWAEYYVDGEGWYPLDASEARKHPEKKDLLFNGLDADRIQFTIGRDIQLEPADRNPERQNYMIYPLVLLDGAQYGKVSTTFSFKDI